MKKTNFLILFILFSITGAAWAQTTDWQQKIEYEMDIDMDVSTNQYTGKSDITYYNNSPDTLNKIYFHLYFNAFQPGSMMDTRSLTIEDPDRRVGDRISQLAEDEIGFQRIQTLKQGKKELNFNIEGTILMARLNEPIMPNSKATFQMEWQSQVPLQIRRSGRDNEEGIEYTMTQWYPKVAEYDYMGWHPNPYIGREFHGVWGDFEVNITIDDDYTIGGTGYLQNPKDIGHGYGGIAEKKEGKNGKLTWKFKAPRVHDFAWAADPDYTHTTAQVPGGPELHFFYQSNEKTEENWSKLPEFMIKALTYTNQNFGKYPYDKYSFIQGGDGGMEYPMSTMITGERNFGSLVGVSVHELLHSWYQGVLAFNESLYPWMDEGFTSFASNEIMQYLFNPDSDEDPQRGAYNAYFYMAKSGNEEPLTTHADHYITNRSYGINSYSKGAVYLSQLSYIIGRENFMTGMRKFFNTYKFRHPNDENIIRVMEEVSDIELDWYNLHWVKTTNQIDYGIEMVMEKDGATYITLKRHGDMMMPIDLLVEMEDGTSEIHYMPLRIMFGAKPVEYEEYQRITHEDWPWVHPTYTLKVNAPTSAIKRVVIDPSNRMADVNPDNNSVSLEDAMESFGN